MFVDLRNLKISLSTLFNLSSESFDKDGICYGPSYFSDFRTSFLVDWEDRFPLWKGRIMSESASVEVETWCRIDIPY